jgi:hypothetical protein
MGAAYLVPTAMHDELTNSNLTRCFEYVTDHHIGFISFLAIGMR